MQLLAHLLRMKIDCKNYNTVTVAVVNVCKCVVVVFQCILLIPIFRISIRRTLNEDH